MASVIFSLVIPIYRPNKKHFVECLNSIIKQKISTDKTELVLVHDLDGENLNQFLVEATFAYPNLKIIESKRHLGISDATNLGVSNATGAYIVLVDQDDVMTEQCLETLEQFLFEKEMLPDLIYSDYEITTENLEKILDVRTPDFSPIRFTNLMYAAHLKVIRREFWHQIGAFDSAFDGAQDHEFFLRAMEITTPIHIPEILYSWRASPTSSQSNGAAKPLAPIRTRTAIENYLNRNRRQYRIERVYEHPTLYRVDYLGNSSEKLSIIIPTKFEEIDGEIALSRLLDSIKNSSVDDNVEIVCVINSISDAREQIAKTNSYFKINWVELHQDEFNFSRAINHGVRKALHDRILILNDDMEFIKFDWFRTLIGFLQQDRIGIVGAKLLYPDGSVQHAGIGIRDDGHCYHILHKKIDVIGHLGEGLVNHEVDAVTGAFMGFRRDTWESIGGFPEQFPGNYNDVGFCLNSWNLGKSVVQVNSIQLIHHESLSRIPDRTEKELNDFLLYLEKFPKVGTFTLTPEHNFVTSTLSYSNLLQDPKLLGWSLSALRLKVIVSIKHRGLTGALENFFGKKHG
jgi:GT2 family glycosyltransferase